MRGSGLSSFPRKTVGYVPQARENLALADEFEMLLDLMIIGENTRGRAPGVPRIVSLYVRNWVVCGPSAAGAARSPQERPNLGADVSCGSREAN